MITETKIAFHLRTPALTVCFISSPPHQHSPNIEIDVLTFLIELDLPEYDSYDILRSQIIKAITQGSDYFGFA